MIVPLKKRGCLLYYWGTGALFREESGFGRGRGVLSVFRSVAYTIIAGLMTNSIVYPKPWPKPCSNCAGPFLLFLPLVSREWKNGSNSSENCTPFLHSLLTQR